MFRKSFSVLLGLMIACGVVVSLGNLDASVGLESARQLWSDVLHDADDLGLQFSRISAYKEMQFGTELSKSVAVGNEEDAAETRYVAAVGERLVPYVNRKGIRYHFHVIKSPEINAFALPGGQIYVYSGMLTFLQSESELAAVLGHEISHVDLRHCIERYQYELTIKKIAGRDIGAIAGFAHNFVAIGYQQDQEIEADLSGERLVIEAGYDPEAGANVYNRMAANFGEHRATQATTLAGEVGQAVENLIGSYFRSHPPSDIRVQAVAAMVAKNRRDLAGRTFYKGIRNYRERTSLSDRKFVEEEHVY